ncbi:MAG: hypothetical protein KC502_05805 [Myxococcales bacterium]|nr:hypothetical protein [Myxococcales bacterium]
MRRQLFGSHSLAYRGALALAGLVATASSAFAAPVSAPGSATPTAIKQVLPPAVAAYPRLEWHGYLRFRPDMVSNGHLGQAVESVNQTGVISASSINPPLSLWPQNNGENNPFSSKVGKSRGEDSIAGATMRLRLRPTIHISKKVRLTFTADLFDNHVLGGSPDYAGALARPDVPLTAFAMTTRPNAVRVHEAYGEWLTPVGIVRIGRQASHWGLGLFANGGLGSTWDHGRPIAYYGGALKPADGMGYDADFANYSDRAAFVTRIAGVYTAVFWDFIGQGALVDDPTRYDAPRWDMTDADDVQQWGIALFSKPLTPSEIAARKKALLEDYRGVLDWGVYGIYRVQDQFTNAKGVTEPAKSTNKDQKNTTLAPRDAWVVATDLWLRYERRISFNKRLVAETEFVYLRGAIGDASPVASGSAAPKEKDIEMFGGALKAAFQIDNMGIYFDAGVASGDDTRCFGVYGPGNCSLDDADGNPNAILTGMKFHKNFRVDNLLFRDVIGAVTNAWYVKPTFSINASPFYSSTSLLGADLSVMFAGALNPEGTPGNGSTLGTEFELRAFIGNKSSYLTSLSFSYLLPGDALDVIGPENKDGRGQWLGATQTVTAENAWRLMLRTTLMF